MFAIRVGQKSEGANEHTASPPIKEEHTLEDNKGAYQLRGREAPGDQMSIICESCYQFHVCAACD